MSYGLGGDCDCHGDILALVARVRELEAVIAELESDRIELKSAIETYASMTEAVESQDKEKGGRR